MARKRIELTPEQEAQIVGRTARGQSLDMIAKATGLSRATVQRRQASLKRSGVVPEKRRVSLEDVEAVESEIDPSDLGTVDKWIPRIEAVAEAAQAEGDHTAFNAAMARLVTLLEHKRKATPLPKVDPNDSPDMCEAAEKVRKRWSDLIKLAGKAAGKS